MQVNKNVQVNSTNTPYPDRIINKDFSNKIKYPIIPLPEIDKLVKSSILDSSGYESESTIREGLLTPISPSDKQIVKKPSQSVIILNTKIVEAKSRLSFWSFWAQLLFKVV